MATSSRQSALFGVNDWKTIYQTFREADFKSYDYETLRKSFIDYLQLYYPETFNDFVESSEFVALLDVIAFMGQGLAFRDDLNTRENFIDTAQRRDSVVKLANLVSYTPKRNLAAQGYLKVVSIKTSQNITDLNGVNLSNQTILWNDPANPTWLEQYNTIINAALINTQRVGRPGNVADILGVTTQEYAISIPETTLPIATFSSTVDGLGMNFELVSVTSINADYMYEIPPAPSGRFNMLYRNDKLGYGSPNTGYFFYFKQGSLQSYNFNLAQQIANQVVEIGDIEGVNNEDTWLFQLNTDNGTRLLWKKVDNVYADAYLQSESSARKLFSVTSRSADRVTYVFGDGVFSEVPVGTFRAYVRASNGMTYTIDPTEMQGITVAFSYVSRVGRIETLTVGLELEVPVSNAQASEPLAEIKQRAPTRYYTQNRMVNGEDYNNFPYTLYSSIIKSKAINRSSIGVSKNLDMLDPTGKYSSLNSFAADGALWQNNTNGAQRLVINNVGNIITFLTDNLAQVLASNRATQYYVQNYNKYSVPTTGDNTVYWQTMSVGGNTLTGYFYSNIDNNKTPISVGAYSTNTVKYITTGALLKFIAPPGYYFDSQYRLIPGIPSPSNLTSFWTTTLNVIGDGYNNGTGGFSNGTGPIVLNGYVPSGAILTTILPVFDNTLSNSIVQECVVKMELQQNFSLVFDNSLLPTDDRWSIKQYNDPTYFVNFLSKGNNVYEVTYRSLAYYFGSVKDIRFSFEKDKLVYDPFSGKILQDYINVLATNTQPKSNNPLAKNEMTNIVGQTVESDGYVNDFEVEVSTTDVNNKTVIIDPDYFNKITGYVTGNRNIGIYVFFEIIQDAISLTREQIIPTSDVVYTYASKSQIEVVKYDYPEGQLFYAYEDQQSSTSTLKGVFYKSVQDNTVTTPYYVLVEQPQYRMLPGRQGLQFQYRHNSNNTTRIDPATTNIIDLYVVTQSYYNAYQNWIQDTTNTVPEPTRPTINELNQTYGDVNNYKMISDSVIMNSVIFKPLFGPKAAPALRATIKVIKASKTTASDSEIRSVVLTAMNSYFDVNNWNFGDTFYFSELSAFLHAEVGAMVSSVVLVPNDPTMKFGDLYEIKCAPYEIFVNAATADDVLVIAALTPTELQIG